MCHGGVEAQRRRARAKGDGKHLRGSSGHEIAVTVGPTSTSGAVSRIASGNLKDTNDEGKPRR